MGDTLTAGQTWAVVIVGIVVVFVILLILVGLCNGMSRLLGGGGKKTPPPEKKAEAAPAQKEAPAPAAKVEEGISNEVVAAISAAVACILGPDKKFSLRSVKRQKSGRSAWNAAGVAENTRPF